MPVLLLAIGCMDSNGPSMHERQDEAMRDPFNYGPEIPDVSGGSTSEFDKQEFKRDVDRVFNP